MGKIKDAELLINPDGSIYHLRLRPEQIGETIIVVGDPQRVPVISKYFDKIEWQIQNREIHTHTGYLGTRRISVLSSGMGTDNIDIIVNELDALANIDFKTKQRKDVHTSLSIIRMGTSGAIQPEIPLNTPVLAEYGLGLDGLLYFYEGHKDIIEHDLTDAFIRHSSYHRDLPKPYVVKASEELMGKIGDGYLSGITVTAPGFYGPQGRCLRLGLADPDMIEMIQSFNFKGKKITNFEMETSALYGLCRLLGHRALTICIAIANRATNQYDPDYKMALEKIIVLFLERLRNRL